MLNQLQFHPEAVDLEWVTESGVTCLILVFNTFHTEIIYTSPFINAEIKIICLR